MARDKSLVTRMARIILQDYVESGVLDGGDQFPSIRQLHARYGASRTTIAEALGQLAARGMLRKQHGRGCFLAETSAQRTVEAAPSSVRTLGLVTPASEANDIIGRLQRGAEAGAKRHGFQIVSASQSAPMGEAYEEESVQVERLIKMGCQAILLDPVARSIDQMERDYLNNRFLDTPIILLGQTLPYMKRTQITFDHRRAGYDMTRLLHAEGHTHIAWLRVSPRGKERIRPALKARHRGYLDALKEAGITPRPQDFWEVPSDQVVDALSGMENLIRFLEESWQPVTEHATAVICPMDTEAVYLINAARQLGVNVGEELRVVGFDDLAIGQGVWPPFPTTLSPHERAGEMAVDCATQMLESGTDECRIFVLPIKILRRDGAVRQASTREDIAARGVVASATESS